jgi:hypothetical protein
VLARVKGFLCARRLWYWLGGVLTGYSLLGFIVLPWVFERQLVGQLQTRLQMQASVERIQFNPFALSLRVEGLDFIDSDGWRAMSLDRLYINLQLDSLSSRSFSFREFYVSGLHLSVRRYDATDSNLSRLMDAWAASTEPAQESIESAASAGGLPRLQIADLQINDASLALTDYVPNIPYIGMVDALDFVIQNLTTLPEAAAGQSFSMTMGNGSQINWAGTLSLAPLHSEGAVTLLGPYTDLAYEYFRDILPVRATDGWLIAGLRYEIGLTDDGGLDVQLSDLAGALSDLALYEPESGALLARFPEISFAGGELQLLERRFALESVEFGRTELHPERFADGSINFLQLFPPTEPAPVVATTPAAGVTAPGPVESPWQLAVGELALSNWQIHIADNVPAREVALTLGLDVRVASINNAPESRMDVEAALNLSSGGELNINGELAMLPDVLFAGQFSLTEFELPPFQPYLDGVVNLSIDSGRFGFNGDVDLAPNAMSYQGSFTLDAVALSAAAAREPLLGIESLQVVAVDITVAEQTRVEVGEVRLSGPYARVEIEADGSSNLARVMMAEAATPDTTPNTTPDSPDAQVATAAASSGEMLPLTVERILIERGSADFADRSLPLPFSVRMHDLGGEVSALSTRSSEPARITLEGQVDDYGLATIEGRLRPLNYGELTELDLRFRNLDIPSMTPYMIKFAGRRIDAGDLDVDLSYRINNQQLSGDNALVMRDLVLGEREPHPDAIDLPLGLAVALLKDRNGVIDLAVPVTGDMNNPQFDYGLIIRSALADVIANIVSSPFRFLARLVGAGEEQELGVIGFRPGRSDLAPPEREKLLSLGSALSERPQLQLRLPGVFHTEADTVVLRQIFLDRRIEAALTNALAEVQQVDAVEDAPPLSRQTVLEGFYRAGNPIVAEPDAATDALAMLRLEHTRAATDSEEEFFDALAYTEALRRMLIEQEPVTSQDLEALASARAAAISQHVATIDPMVAEQLSIGTPSGVTVLHDGWVAMELNLEARQ